MAAKKAGAKELRVLLGANVSMVIPLAPDDTPVEPEAAGASIFDAPTAATISATARDPAWARRLVCPHWQGIAHQNQSRVWNGGI